MVRSVPLIALVFLGMSAADCGPGAGVKVWEFQPEESAKPLKGWHRGEEVKTFGDTDVKYGVNATDMEFILNKLRSCESNSALNSMDNTSLIKVLTGNVGFHK